jgi:hypothetical protein
VTDEPQHPEVPKPDSLTSGLDSGEIVRENVVLPKPPGKETVDNTEAEAAVAFLKAGVPLQDGTPDNPTAALAKAKAQAE